MHSRRRPTVNIAISKLTIPEDVKVNDTLVQLYLKLDKGEIHCALTRVPISSIISGYCERKENHTVISSNLTLQYVPVLEQAIRGGSRPLLDLYWSPLAPGGGAYVCADDETVLAAYLRLNFAWVPCRVLRPKKVKASEASIWLEKHGELVRLKKVVAPIVDTYKSFVGEGFPPFYDLVHALIDHCQRTRSAIVTFHKDDGSGVHYHQMLHAFLRRHERALDSICRLVELGRTEHAEALTRVAYEGFLNFYIDWLSPEFFGPRLQLLSAARSAQTTDHTSRNHGLTVLDNFVEFLENTSEKARISPLGSFFHSTIYPPLSLVAHQSYGHLEEEASSFGETNLPDSPSRVKQLGRWLDVLTTALVLRVRNDISFNGN
jgi:hypothetical protein